LSKNSVEQAVAALVKACACSTFALDIINDHVQDWSKVLYELELDVMMWSPHSVRGALG